MITFGGFTIGVMLIVALMSGIIAVCFYSVKRPPALSPVEYDKQISKMDNDRLAQIETASSTDELDEIEARWNEAKSQIRRARK